jgi:hypothetical protein
VRVAAQHNIGPQIPELLDRLRVVGEHHAWRLGAVAARGRVRIGLAAPEIVRSGDDQPLPFRSNRTERLRRTSTPSEPSASAIAA